MKRGERRRIDKLKTPKVGERGRRPKPGRLSKFAFQLSLDRVVPVAGGRGHFVEIARLSENEKVRQLVALWDSLPKREQNRCQLERLCEAVGLDPATFLGDVAATAFARGIDTSKLIVAISQPLAFEKIAKRALEPDGHRERKMFLEAVGVLGSRTGGSAIFESTDKESVSRETEPLDVPPVEEGNILDPHFELASDD